MFDRNKNEKSIRLLGVAPWSSDEISQVFLFCFKCHDEDVS
jgi:hypothetical protein